MVKMKDKKADNIPLLSLVNNSVVVNNKRIALPKADKELFHGITKLKYVSYYSMIAPRMVPLVRGRPIAMFRFPDGPGRGFYQKNVPDYFPKWVHREAVEKVRYAVCESAEELVYLATQVVEMHPWPSRKPKIGFPDRMIFDLDPSDNDIRALRKAAEKLGDFLQDIGLKPFIMTTGGKGFHITCPIKPEFRQDYVRDFALKISRVLADSDESLTTELVKSKREGRIFIDVNRNSAGQNAVAPYTVRANPGAPIAAPFEWDDLANTEPRTYSLSNLPPGNPWKNIDGKAVSLKKIIKRLKE
jgi:bifunctional non-homologous end joining protein LigD